ncbi:hypothetical protein [Salipiger bermudensis]|uniref:hypothetical protein n=1 Tax=Salipiger bermudensis TaxID=344736 RepID=UPI00300A8042
MALDATRASIERDTALDDHALSRPGKLKVRPTEPMVPGRNLSRAYAPGMADAVTEIAADPPRATGDPRKRTLVAVISH